MKEYECLVPGCPWHTRAEDISEVVRRAAEHLRSVHGESVVRPDMIGHIKERIHDAVPAQ